VQWLPTYVMLFILTETLNEALFISVVYLCCLDGDMGGHGRVVTSPRRVIFGGQTDLDIAWGFGYLPPSLLP
jgi:hypothetical protein